MRVRMARGLVTVIFLAALLAWVSATGCSPDSTLHGSISEQLDLDFDDVRVVVQSDVMRIEYVRYFGERASKVCKIAVDRTALVGGFNFIADAEFLDRVTVTRAADDGALFPEIESGFVQLFDLDLTFASAITGDFAVEFVTGQTLGGDFDADPIVLGE